MNSYFEANDANVKCKVIEGLTTFTFKIHILDDLDSNSSTVLMTKEITQETSLSR